MAFILLTPADEARIQRNRTQNISGGDDDPAAKDAAIGRLVDGLPPPIRASQNLGGAILRESAHEQMGNGPRRAALYLRDRLIQAIGPDIGVDHDHDVGSALHDGRTNRGALTPRLSI